MTQNIHVCAMMTSAHDLTMTNDIAIRCSRHWENTIIISPFDSLMDGHTRMMIMSAVAQW